MTSIAMLLTLDSFADPILFRPDGSNDMTAAIQATIDGAQSGSVLHFMKGVYPITKPLMITQRTSLRLEGEGKNESIIRGIFGAKASSEMSIFNPLFHVKSSDSIEFSNLVFEGNHGQSCGDAMGTVAEVAQAAIHSEDSSSGKILNCRFSSKANPLINAIVITQSQNNISSGWEIANNRFTYLNGIYSGCGYGILMGKASYNRIINNTFESDRNFGRHGVYLAAGSTHNQVIENTMNRYNSLSIAFNSYPWHEPNSWNLIYKNHITNNFSYASGSQMTGIGLSGKNSNNIILENQIENVQEYGIQVRAGLFQNQQYGPENNFIIGNHIKKSGLAGILLSGSIGSTVDGNTIIGAGDMLLRSSKVSSSSDQANYPGILSVAYAQIIPKGNKIRENTIQGCSTYRHGIIINTTGLTDATQQTLNTVVKANKVAVADSSNRMACYVDTESVQTPDALDVPYCKKKELIPNYDDFISDNIAIPCEN